MSRVSVGPIRQSVESYIRNGGNYTDICRGLEWPRTDRVRLERTLGIMKMSNGQLAQRINYENAVKIIRAIGGNPVDYGV